MQSTLTEEQLRSMREGCRLNYHGVEWQIADYSTYSDQAGYETEEWLLESPLGKEYYLLREFSPVEVGATVQWYLAEELPHPKIYDPATAREVTYRLAEQILSGQSPYPQLQALNRTYEFESQTEGTYDADAGSRSRTTWDYWDTPHLWNLALEAWSDGSFAVYSTRTVQPSDFSDLISHSPLNFTSARSRRSKAAQPQQRWAAIVLMIVGFFLMIFGI